MRTASTVLIARLKTRVSRLVAAQLKSTLTAALGGTLVTARLKPLQLLTKAVGVLLR